MSVLSLPDRLPLFPLPDHVLLPEIPTLYRIFEPRYRALVRDLLALPPERHWLAVPRLQPGWEQAYLAAPAIVPIACAARLRRAVPLADGEFQVVIEGVRRCRLEELPAVTPYRIARPLPYDDLPDPGLDPVDALIRLMTQVQALGDRVQLPEDLTTLATDAAGAVRILDRVAGVVLGDPEVRQTWLEARRLSERLPLLERAIAALASTSQAGRRRRFRPSEN